MTADQLNNLAATAAAETARIEAATNQATTTGYVFDHMAPLPPMPDYRHRSWEPAARHYRDLTPEEKAEQTS